MTSIASTPDEGPRVVGELTSAGLPATPRPVEASPLPMNAPERCTPTATGSKERENGAVESCVIVRPAKAARSLQASPTAAPIGTCAIGMPGSYTYERFQYCVSGVEVIYILRDQNGNKIGSGAVETSTSATLPAQGTTWNEQIVTKMTKAEGDVTSLTVRLKASCTTGCTTPKNAPWLSQTLTLGKSTPAGAVSYASSPGAGQQTEFATSYQLYVTMPGAAPTDPSASWSNPRKIRCDNAVGGSSTAGCVVPSVTPVVSMSAASSDPGALVAAYGWAQKNLNGAWGTTSNPLTRSTSGVADRTDVTCSDFTAQTTLVTADSCGDFPFGEAQEGGVSGAQCVEAISHPGSGGWSTYILNDGHRLDRTSPCVQAHVAPDAKKFANAQLVQGFVDQRVIDGDKFELKVSAPDAGPQTVCLNNPNGPPGALQNGNGWFKNTTEPVALINKTDPADGPGFRPTQAQACIGRGTQEGTDTSNPVTGMKDADDFKKKNGVSYQLVRCHLIAKILGGEGTSAITRYNLVPCWQSGMNTGTPSMRTFETKAQKLVQGSLVDFGVDDALFYQVTPVYKDKDSTIPLGVTMTARIERADGTTGELFPDVYVTNTYRNTGSLNLGN
ncbi:DNA/RNA non-specific endonuclease (plasmid) [Streptomyces sp. BI20]|uniref:DNA/RNA non-specific endonuclease n=1 Tax=Streptomyces sp. BI20 TaxID=3403460 RepID=UPI003C78B880